MARQQSFSCFLLNTGWHDIFGVRVEKILSYRPKTKHAVCACVFFGLYDSIFFRGLPNCTFFYFDKDTSSI